LDFKLDGPAVWRGGYNSGRTNSINHTFLFTECGVNRVMLRSTLKPGTIILSATRTGLVPAVARLDSTAVFIADGLCRDP